MAEQSSCPMVEVNGCPNTPPCEHPAWIHDIDSYDDPKPMCCADGCNCGQST